MSVPAAARRAPLALLASVAAALLAASLPAITGAHDTSGAFVTRSGSELRLAGQPYTFTGINMYNANSDGWCREALSDSEFGTALDAAGLGGEAHGVLRAWFFQTLATDKGTNARDWTRFDRTIAIAKAKGYKVIATLTDQWGECGADVAPTYGFKTQDWYTGGYAAPDPGLAAPAAYGSAWLSYRTWAAEVVARYANEPAILAWQLINEAEVNPGGAFGACPPGDGPRDVLRTWATDMSNFVRSIDANHLISLGTIGGGQCGSQGSQYQDVHDLPNIDLCEVHDYTPTQAIPGDPWNGFGVRVQQCAALDKPLIVGETGIAPNRVGGDYEDRAMAFRSKIYAQRALGVDGIVAWNFHPGGSTLDNFDIGPGDPVLAELAAPVPAIVVTSSDDTNDFTCDVTHCSLREAIDAANNRFGADLIAFAIPGAGIHTIAPSSALPAIRETVLIDGSTQPGTAGSPLIALDGTSAGPGAAGLSATGNDVTVRGLRITGFNGAGVASSGTGLRVDGSTIDANGGDGIAVTGYPYDASISGNRIHDNGGLGIDYGDNGVTYSNPSPPSLMSISQYGDQVSGSISGGSGTYAVEVFKLGSCDPSGYGEGDLPIASLDVLVPSGFPSYASFDVTVPGGIAQGDVFSATATGPDGTTSEFSNCASRPKPNLSLTLDDESETVGVGEALHYTLAVTNATNINATNIVLSHTLPAGATFGQAIATQGTCAEAGGVVTCQLGSLASFGFPATITVDVDVRVGSAGIAATSASVTASEPETTLADNVAADTTTVAVATPATFTVTSNNDANDGTCSVAHCSLREAILAANANPGRDTIVFSLPGSTLIQPASPGLPVVTGPVVIDATSSPGFAGQPVVVLSGTNAFGAFGLRIAGGDSEVRGLVLNSWYNPAVQLERWGGNTVAGNWFGLDATGTIRTPNNSSGVTVYSSGNLIGGTSAADRNVLSGSSSGVSIGKSRATAPLPHDNVVQGNYVGLNAAGTAAISVTTGIVTSGNATLIARNVVAGAGQDGILITGDPSGPASVGNIVQGNIVGLDATGTVALPNGTGLRVHLNSRSTVVGGPGAGDGNT
ncbi:MAG: CSLREA domain-containing protein, partial [Candidatus Limnocylindrales bacterium]